MWFVSRIYDWFMRGAEEACLREWREELLGGVEGRVLEVGVGTGANLPVYSESVSELVVVEPDRHMRGRFREKMGEESVSEVRLVDATAEDLPFEEESFDVVVSTLVLCSVDDLEAALREIRRVLRPDGRFFFLEHVAAHDKPGRRKWQERIEPVWKRVAGNCHLTRETAERIRGAGFEIEELKRESMRKVLPIVRPTVRGWASPSLSSRPPSI